MSEKDYEVMERSVLVCEDFCNAGPEVQQSAAIARAVYQVGAAICRRLERSDNQREQVLELLEGIHRETIDARLKLERIEELLNQLNERPR